MLNLNRENYIRKTHNVVKTVEFPYHSRDGRLSPKMEERVHSEACDTAAELESEMGLAPETLRLAEVGRPYRHYCKSKVCVYLFYIE